MRTTEGKNVGSYNNFGNLGYALAFPAGVENGSTAMFKITGSEESNATIEFRT